MKRPNKTLLGAATFGPLLYIFLLAGLMLALKVLMGDKEPSLEVSDALGVLSLLLFAVLILTILLSLGLTVGYLIHAIRREDLKPKIKASWAGLLLLFGIFAQPFYWYLYIRNERSDWSQPKI